MFQLKVYGRLSLLCCLITLVVACGKKGPPTPLSKIREREQKEQLERQTATKEAPVVDTDREADNAKDF